MASGRTLELEDVVGAIYEGAATDQWTPTLDCIRETFESAGATFEIIDRRSRSACYIETDTYLEHLRSDEYIQRYSSV